jgi:hypothetical protein
MQITPENQHDSNTAQVTVVVGCGLDGNEGNEPSFSYVINPDGATITRDTDNGQVLGSIKLGLADLNFLCNVSFDPPSAQLRDVAANVLLQAVRIQVYLGEEAGFEFRKRLEQVWASPGTGKVWGFSKAGLVWAELVPGAFKAAADCETVTIDGATKEGAWKFTYYPQSHFATYLE